MTVCSILWRFSWTPWFLKKTDIFSVKNIFSVWLQILFETDSDPLVFDIFNHIQGDRSASTKPSFLKISRQVKFDFRISKTLLQPSVEPAVSWHIWCTRIWCISFCWPSLWNIKGQVWQRHLVTWMRKIRFSFEKMASKFEATQRHSMHPQRSVS